MARIRTIKPGFFLNEQLAELPFQWRLLFIGLWTQADREGRLEDRPVRLKAQLFPYDDLKIEEGLGCLANAGLLVRYDTDGRKLMAIPTWHKHQQPHVKEQQSELPEPKHMICTVQAPDLPLRKGTDQEGKGTDHSAHEARFARFWESYPRKVGKGAAEQIWMRLKPSDALTAAILSAVETQAASQQWKRENGQYIPHAKTWLSQRRWEDEVDVAGQKPTRPLVPFEQTELHQQMYRNNAAYRADYDAKHKAAS